MNIYKYNYIVRKNLGEVWIIKRNVLALITAQDSCKRIIDVAKEYAVGPSAEVMVLTVQPLKATAENRSKDMICLTRLSRETGTDIKIIYSDKPIRKIVSQIEESRPLHIFLGQGSDSSTFLSRLRFARVKAPISVVGFDGIIYSMPPMPEDILMLG